MCIFFPAINRWIQGDAQQLPFPDGSFDAATMGYGLRNVASIPKALSELHRVLRPGATVAILDFNNSTNQIVDAFQVFADLDCKLLCLYHSCMTQGRLLKRRGSIWDNGVAQAIV